MARVFQLFAKLAKVINFAVKNGRHRLRFIPYGLAATRKIDNAEAPHAYCDRWREQHTVAIRAAVGHSVHHPADSRLACFS